MSSWRIPAGYGRPIPSTSSSSISINLPFASTSTANLTSYHSLMDQILEECEGMSKPSPILKDYPMLQSSSDEDDCSGAVPSYSAYKFVRKTFATSEASKDSSTTLCSGIPGESESTIESWNEMQAVNQFKGHRRVDEILRRLHYLVSKRGLDLFSLQMSIKEDEEEEKEAERTKRDEHYRFAKQQADVEYENARAFSAARGNSNIKKRDDIFGFPGIETKFANYKRSGSQSKGQNLIQNCYISEEDAELKLPNLIDQLNQECSQQDNNNFNQLNDGDDDVEDLYEEDYPATGSLSDLLASHYKSQSLKKKLFEKSQKALEENMALANLI